MGNDFIAMGKCRFCGKDDGTILLNQRMRPIKDEETRCGICDDCKKRFETMCYFIGDCGHAGFISKEYLSKVLKPEAFAGIEKIFRMEKCFACINGQSVDDLEKI